MYGADLAHVHEAGFADVAAAAARELAHRLPAPSRIVDLGCGGGTLAGRLVRQGHQVWGVDASPDMVALAHARVPAARFDVADALAVRLPACHAITLVGEVLNYALADRPPAAADAFFGRAFVALDPGGLLLFDVATLAKAPADYVARRDGDGWRVEAEVKADGDALTRTITTWRTVGGTERVATEVHRQRLLDPAWVLARLEAAGFEAEETGGYDDLPFEEGWDAFVARKA